MQRAAQGPDVLWRLAPGWQLASWVLLGAHRVPLHIEAGAALSGELGRIVGRIVGSAGAGIETTVLAVPMTVLLVVAVVAFLVARVLGARTVREAASGAALAGITHGVVLWVLARLAGGPTLGFRVVVVEAGIGIQPSAATAAIAGLVLGFASALAGALSSDGPRAELPERWRAAAGAWWRGLLWACAAGVVAGPAAAVASGVAATGFGSESVGGAGAAAFGPLFAVNGLAAVVVLAHGVPFSFTAAGGARVVVDYLNFGASGHAAPAAWWLLLAVPVAAGVAAGRHARRRGIEPLAAGAVFGAAWAVTLAGLCVLLRIQTASTYSIAGLIGADARVVAPSVGAALFFGELWGFAGAFVAAALTRAPSEGRPAA